LVAEPPAGLIVDWGGVLTTPLYEAIKAWLGAERIAPDHYREVVGRWFDAAYELDPDSADGAGAAPGAGAVNPIHALEDGSLDPPEFERMLASRLRTTDGDAVAASGLLRRMFAGFRPEESMYEVVRRARAAGIRTGLLSNSWGNDYPREVFAELFDVVVISTEVGMRKPAKEIFRYALDRLVLEPRAAVFVDDIVTNVAAAEALGIVGVHHRDVPATVKRLEQLLAVPLR
jgi:putative hydrolase of the HAD superfamily